MTLPEILENKNIIPISRINGSPITPRPNNFAKPPHFLIYQPNNSLNNSPSEDYTSPLLLQNNQIDWPSQKPSPQQSSPILLSTLKNSLNISNAPNDIQQQQQQSLSNLSCSSSSSSFKYNNDDLIILPTIPSSPNINRSNSPMSCNESDLSKSPSKMLNNSFNPLISSSSSSNGIPTLSSSPTSSPTFKSLCNEQGCMICANTTPYCLSGKFPSWSAILWVCLYSLHKLHPEKDFVNLREDVYPSILKHWSKICGNRETTSNWKKQIQDSLSHSRKLFESGVDILGQNGYWRLKKDLNPWNIETSMHQVNQYEANNEKSNDSNEEEKPFAKKKKVINNNNSNSNNINNINNINSSVSNNNNLHNNKNNVKNQPFYNNSFILDSNNNNQSNHISPDFHINSAFNNIKPNNSTYNLNNNNNNSTYNNNNVININQNSDRLFNLNYVDKVRELQIHLSNNGNMNNRSLLLLEFKKSLEQSMLNANEAMKMVSNLLVNLDENNFNQNFNYNNLINNNNNNINSNNNETIGFQYYSYNPSTNTNQSLNNKKKKRNNEIIETTPSFEFSMYSHKNENNNNGIMVNNEWRN
ncbi:hypothetical protein CYY_005740 [Polysphondylium violaceum]|uniref:Uncharacterized protein n=1 Tax=Polysphondylium violaceum TaxID=133409 RepID=A0A8J4V3V5_9MYCE|nr:hypothetical protein CYY_005740 [Polysphondylium violaceum]